MWEGRAARQRDVGQGACRGKSGISTRRPLVGNDLGGFMVPSGDTVLLRHRSCLFEVQPDKTTESRHPAGPVALSHTLPATTLPPTSPPPRHSRSRQALRHHGRKCGFSSFRVYLGPLGGWCEMQMLGCGAMNSDARSESAGRASPLQGHVGAVWTQAPGHTGSAAKGAYDVLLETPCVCLGRLRLGGPTNPLPQGQSLALPLVNSPAPGSHQATSRHWHFPQVGAHTSPG